MVLDSAGIGALPDAAIWGDSGTDTIGHVLAAENLGFSLTNGTSFLL